MGGAAPCVEAVGLHAGRFEAHPLGRVRDRLRVRDRVRARVRDRVSVRVRVRDRVSVGVRVGGRVRVRVRAQAASERTSCSVEQATECAAARSVLEARSTSCGLRGGGS